MCTSELIYWCCKVVFFFYKNFCQLSIAILFLFVFGVRLRKYCRYTAWCLGKSYQPKTLKETYKEHISIPQKNCFNFAKTKIRVHWFFDFQMDDEVDFGVKNERVPLNNASYGVLILSLTFIFTDLKSKLDLLYVFNFYNFNWVWFQIWI